MFSTTLLLNIENCFNEKENFFSIMILAIGQGIMFYIGWLIGQGLEGMLVSYSKIISFILFALIGIKMIMESFNRKYKGKVFKLDTKNAIAFLSLGKGINALIIGIAFLSLNHSGFNTALLLIGISIILALFGIQAGKKSARYSLGNLAELIGGLLILGSGFTVLI